MNNRLKQLRKALGLKQREVAERLGVAVGVIGKWEVGENPVPRARIYQICKEYHVNREWFERGVGEMFEPDPVAQSEEEAQIKFCKSVFDSMPPGLQKVVLDALRERVEANARASGAQGDQERAAQGYEWLAAGYKAERKEDDDEPEGIWA